MTHILPNPLLAGLLERLHREREPLYTAAQSQHSRSLLEGRISALEARFKTEDLMTLMKAGVVLELGALHAEFEAQRQDEFDGPLSSEWLLELAGEAVTLGQLEQVLALLETHSGLESTASSSAPTLTVQGLTEPQQVPRESPNPAPLEPAPLKPAPLEPSPTAAQSPTFAGDASQSEPKQDTPDDPDELERLERHIFEGGFPRHLGPLAVWLGRSESHLRGLLGRSRTLTNVGMDYFGLRSVEYALSWPELELLTHLLELQQSLPISSLLRQASLHALEGERMVGVMMAQSILYRCEWRQGGLHFSMRNPLLELYARWLAQSGERPAPLEVLEVGLRDAVSTNRFEEVQRVLERLTGTPAHAALLKRFPALLELLEHRDQAVFVQPGPTHSPVEPDRLEVPDLESTPLEVPMDASVTEVMPSSDRPEDPRRAAEYADLALLLSPQHHPLLERVRQAGLPCPHDCHKDVFYKGQTTNAQALLVWTLPGLEVMLSEFEMQPPGTRIIPPNHPQMLELLHTALAGLQAGG